jgi:hypothetical protein
MEAKKRRRSFKRTISIDGKQLVGMQSISQAVGQSLMELEKVAASKYPGAKKISQKVLVDPSVLLKDSVLKLYVRSRFEVDAKPKAAVAVKTKK